MSLSLEFSSNLFSSFIPSRFLKEIASDEVTFHRSGSVKFITPDIFTTVDVTEQIYQGFRHHEYYFKGRSSLPNEPSPCEVIVKILFGPDEEVYSEILQSYIQEAKFYRDHLCGSKFLYGKGVPKTYGLYETKLTWKLPNMLVDCACMV
ncbi:hypothetical protein H2248_009059 [Termitomyces sp. 'cryptogamus']|nr:hypothetical protein H2248_009059 [Termitomyces sp. 'cryptogamus']